MLPNGFTDADADRFAALGFDAVRLAWFWRGLEPAKGAFDPAYLEGIAAVQEKLSRRGVFTVLDSHQDGYGDRFNGLGFPGLRDLSTTACPSTPGLASR